MIIPSQLIAELLIDRGLVSRQGNSESWPVFISFLPNDPDDAVCIYDVDGKTDARLMGTGEWVEHHGIQIIVRSKDYQLGFAKAKNIAQELDLQNKLSVLLGSVESEDLETLELAKLDNFSRRGTILSLGMEPEGKHRRRLFSINGIMTFSEETSELVALRAQPGDSDSDAEPTFLRTSDGFLLFAQP